MRSFASLRMTAFMGGVVAWQTMVGTRRAREKRDIESMGPSKLRVNGSGCTTFGVPQEHRPFEAQGKQEWLCYGGGSSSGGRRVEGVWEKGDR